MENSQGQDSSDARQQYRPPTRGRLRAAEYSLISTGDMQTVETSSIDHSLRQTLLMQEQGSEKQSSWYKNPGPFQTVCVIAGIGQCV